MPRREPKPLIFVGTCLDDLSTFPAAVRRSMGFALHIAQLGGKHPSSSPLRGFGGAGVLEVIEDYDGRAFRVVYTVKFQDRIYGLHAFEKKSKRRIATPKTELDMIRRRLREAEEIHRNWLVSKETGR
jgi:phage-related protein